MNNNSNHKDHEGHQEHQDINKIPSLFRCILLCDLRALRGSISLQCKVVGKLALTLVAGDNSLDGKLASAKKGSAMNRSIWLATTTGLLLSLATAYCQSAPASGPAAASQPALRLLGEEPSWQKLETAWRELVKNGKPDGPGCQYQNDVNALFELLDKVHQDRLLTSEELAALKSELGVLKMSRVELEIRHNSLHEPQKGFYTFRNRSRWYNDFDKAPFLYSVVRLYDRMDGLESLAKSPTVHVEVYRLLSYSSSIDVVNSRLALIEAGMRRGDEDDDKLSQIFSRVKGFRPLMENVLARTSAGAGSLQVNPQWDQIEQDWYVLRPDKSHSYGQQAIIETAMADAFSVAEAMVNDGLLDPLEANLIQEQILVEIARTGRLVDDDVSGPCRLSRVSPLRESLRRLETTLPAMKELIKKKKLRPEVIRKIAVTFRDDCQRVTDLKNVGLYEDEIQSAATVLRDSPEVLKALAAYLKDAPAVQRFLPTTRPVGEDLVALLRGCEQMRGARLPIDNLERIFRTTSKEETRDFIAAYNPMLEVLERLERNPSLSPQEMTLLRAIPRQIVAVVWPGLPKVVRKSKTPDEEVEDYQFRYTEWGSKKYLPALKRLLACEKISPEVADAVTLFLSIDIGCMPANAAREDAYAMLDELEKKAANLQDPTGGQGAERAIWRQIHRAHRMMELARKVSEGVAQIQKQTQEGLDQAATRWRQSIQKAQEELIKQRFLEPGETILLRLEGKRSLEAVSAGDKESNPSVAMQAEASRKRLTVVVPAIKYLLRKKNVRPEVLGLVMPGLRGDCATVNDPKAIAGVPEQDRQEAREFAAEAKSALTDLEIALKKAPAPATGPAPVASTSSKGKSDLDDAIPFEP